MKDFLVYGHVYGLPNYLDGIDWDLTEGAMECCHTERQVEEYIEKFNYTQPTDKYGRKRNLYIRWCN
jgi:hypothetical protein